jgi:hypothetical protein
MSAGGGESASRSYQNRTLVPGLTIRIPFVIPPHWGASILTSCESLANVWAFLAVFAVWNTRKVYQAQS